MTHSQMSPEREHMLEELRAANAEIAQLRQSYREFKLHILFALNFTNPWAVTVVSEKQIVDRIEEWGKQIGKGRTCSYCSRTEPHTHCPECGSTEHVASECDMMG